MAGKCRFVVNAENGDVLYRSSVTDSLPILFRLVDDETAKAIFDKKVTGKQVADAALKKDMSQPGFDYAEYDKRRQAAKKVRCMSSREMIPVNDVADAVAEAVENDDANIITLGDIVGEAKKSEPVKETRKRSETMTSGY